MFRNHAHSPGLVMQCAWVCVHAWVFQFVLFFLIYSTVVHCLWPLLLISLTSCFWASRGTETSSVSDLFPVYVMPIGDSYFSSRTSQIMPTGTFSLESKPIVFCVHTSLIVQVFKVIVNALYQNVMMMTKMQMNIMAHSSATLIRHKTHRPFLMLWAGVWAPIPGFSCMTNQN